MYLSIFMTYPLPSPLVVFPFYYGYHGYRIVGNFPNEGDGKTLLIIRHQYLDTSSKIVNSNVPEIRPGGSSRRAREVRLDKSPLAIISNFYDNLDRGDWDSPTYLFLISLSLFPYLTSIVTVSPSLSSLISPL